MSKRMEWALAYVKEQLAPYLTPDQYIDDVAYGDYKLQLDIYEDVAYTDKPVSEIAHRFTFFYDDRDGMEFLSFETKLKVEVEEFIIMHFMEEAPNYI